MLETQDYETLKSGNAHGRFQRQRFCQLDHKVYWKIGVSHGKFKKKNLSSIPIDRALILLHPRSALRRRLVLNIARLGNHNTKLEHWSFLGNCYSGVRWKRKRNSVVLCFHDFLIIVQSSSSHLWLLRNSKGVIRHVFLGNRFLNRFLKEMVWLAMI